MMETNTKIKWIAGLIGGIVMSLTLLGCAKVHTEIIIPVPPVTIWSVLTDVRGYKEWNPVLVPLEGELRQGEKLTYQMTQPDGRKSKVKAKVIEVLDEKKLHQFGGIRGILTFNHTWLLDPVDGGTRVTQHEEYSGIGVWFWNYSWVEPAYSQANEALKTRVLSLMEDVNQSKPK